MGWLFLLFITVPIVELWLLIRVGALIGAGPTVAIVLVTGVLGGTLVRMQGTRALDEIRAALNAGRLPGMEIVSGLMVLVGGAFLLTPGILTDTVGFLLMIPPLRRLVAARVLKHFRARGPGQVFFFHTGPSGPMPGVDQPHHENPENLRDAEVTGIYDTEDDPESHA